MKRLMKPILAMSLLGAFAYGQQDGVPNFGAADVHETDIINLQTLVPTINIPVVSKNEAIPLGITLTAQQYCYTFNNVQSGTYLRECNGEFGAYATGLLNATFTYSKVQPVSGNCPNGGTATSYSAWYLLTSDGLDSHPISPNTGLVLNDPAHSGLPQGNCTATYAINEITIDGSGYTVSLSIPAGTLSPWLGSESTFSVGDRHRHLRKHRKFYCQRRNYPYLYRLPGRCKYGNDGYHGGSPNKKQWFGSVLGYKW